jgi:hypothetical protein
VKRSLKKEERLRQSAPIRASHGVRHGLFAVGGALATLPVWLSDSLSCGMLRSRNCLSPLLRDELPFHLFISELSAKPPAA